jgi:hypothetical protein
MSKKWEIGLVQFYYDSALEIVGPFSTLAEANEECSKRNKKLGFTNPGRGQLGWMVANWEEIPRQEGCRVENK